MAVTFTHVPYDNFVLSAEIENQLASKLDLLRFCQTDTSLVGVAGDKKIINRYTATDATENLLMGEGNTKAVEVGFEPVEYGIQLYQNTFKYYDEQRMKDPLIVTTGVNHLTTDMVNTIQAGVYAEYRKATLKHYTGTATGTGLNFGAFVDATALLGFENIEDAEIFAILHPKDLAAIRKNLKDDLKYVESFARNGYVGTVAGVNLYTKQNAIEKELVIATREAVTMFVKTGTEVEQERNADIRLNEIFTRKYGMPALTDATKVVLLCEAVDPEAE